METLSRKKRASPVQITTDENLTLSFKVSSSYSASLKKLMGGAAMNQNSKPHSVEKMVSLATKDGEEEEDSWESKGDFILNICTEKDSSVPWHEDVESFPDEFPILLINLSRLSQEHMGKPLHTTSDADAVSLSIQTVFNSSKFSCILEALFEQKIAYHTTYGVYKEQLQHLSGLINDVWAAIDYPSIVDEEVPLCEMLIILQRPTPWKSVNIIKEYMSQSSRDLRWKAQVIEELEKLAAQEQESKNIREKALSAEIDQLSYLRDMFRLKLSTIHNKQQQHFIQLQLHDVERRLRAQLDMFLAPPVPLKDSLDFMYGHKANICVEMNVLDKILSMIFSRLQKPADAALDAHYASLKASHHYIRRLWQQEFGRLPLRSRNLEEDEATDESSIDVNEAIKCCDDDERVTAEENPRECETFACVTGVGLLRLNNDERQHYLLG